jgi:hypothetical protein
MAKSHLGKAGLERVEEGLVALIRGNVHQLAFWNGVADVGQQSLCRHLHLLVLQLTSTITTRSCTQ